MGPCIRLIDGDIKAIELVLTGELGSGIYVYTPIEVRVKGMNTSHSLPSISGIMYRLLVCLLSVLVANAMDDAMDLNMSPPLVDAYIVLLKQTIKLITLN